MPQRRRRRFYWHARRIILKPVFPGGGKNARWNAFGPVLRRIFGFNALSRVNGHGPIVDRANGYSYYVVAPADWNGAQAEAQSIGGNLVTVRNAAENTWITSNLLVDLSSSGGPDLSDTPVWLGLYDPDFGDGGGAQHAADFILADGEPVTYTNWYPGEPNNNGDSEYYTVINWDFVAGMGPAGTWNDVGIDGALIFQNGSTGPYYGIAEVLPEPASAGVLVAVGAVMLLRPRVRAAV